MSTTQIITAFNNAYNFIFSVALRLWNMFSGNVLLCVPVIMVSIYFAYHYFKEIIKLFK